MTVFFCIFCSKVTVYFTDFCSKVTVFTVCDNKPKAIVSLIWRLLKYAELFCVYKLVMNSTNIVVSANKVHRSGGTGMALFAVAGAKVYGNEVGDAKGVHANGVSFYVGATDILFCNNLVFGQ